MTRRSARAIALTAGGGFAAIGLADPPSAPPLTQVPNANRKANGYAPPNRLSPEIQEIEWARGSNELENPKCR